MEMKPFLVADTTTFFYGKVSHTILGLLSLPYELCSPAISALLVAL
jgi:hypothetical protein